MTAQVLEIRKLKVSTLACSACGAEAEATCNCGVPYVPASTRARRAIEAAPEKSNRAIAEEIGVSYETVRQARTGDKSLSPETHIGKDGKNYPARRHEAEQTPEDSAIEDFKMLVELSLRIKDVDLSLISGKPGMKEAARRVVAEWSKAEGNL